MAAQVARASPPTGGSADEVTSSSGVDDPQSLSDSANPTSPQARNPRRPPAHRSVSLLHASYGGPPGKAVSTHRAHPSTLAPSTTAEPPSTVSSKPLCQKDSSGESSNADNWFEKSNNKVRPSPALLTENDPPFLLRNPSSSSSPDDGPPGRLITSHASSSHIIGRPGFAFIPTLASSSEDFRSVIDDLTVENKKLKRKLKKYEKLQDSHLQEEKLFEVRVHSLPASKKRELEDMLRKFVMSCEGDQTSSARGYIREGARLPTGKRTSSHTSTRINDSAYGSMSHSGPMSSAQSGQQGPTLSAQGSSQQSRRHSHQSHQNISHHHISHQQHQNIQSYLHDIPVGLLPKNPVAMTEKTKRKLVVRRLEQVFAGKASNSGGHQQPMQQQEVSQLAARADRRALEATGAPFPEEGAREAMIMPETGSEKRAAHHSATIASKSLASNRKNGKDIEDHDFAEDARQFEQRPTRPLDLDPYRAQVAADNIQYIRHLGFSPLDAGSTAAHEEGHGWIYLNLLINMAQLHTLNVTTEFVLKSIAEVSRKLELSADCRKVRWRGGAEVTRTSSDSSPDDEHRAGQQTQQKFEPRKRSKLATTVSNSGDGLSEVVSKSQNTSSRDRFAYTPLFYHKQEDEEDEDVSEDERMSDWSSPQHQPQGDSSGFTSSGIRTTSSNKKRGDNGPIIFYNRVNFCTDLSGDARGKDLVFVNNTGYNRMATAPIGADDTSSSLRMAEPRGPLSSMQSLQLSDVMEVDKKSSSDIMMDVDIPGDTPLSKSSSEASSNPSITAPFEASGVGGILPQDHFAIRVKVQTTKTAPTSQQQLRGKLIPRQMQGLLGSATPLDGASDLSKTSVVRQKVISERRKDLPPSTLPPPSFLPQEASLGDSDASDYSDESGSEEEEDEDDVDIPSEARALPSAAPQALNWPILESSDEESEEDDEDEEDQDSSSSGSLDLLAYAREVDPATIRAQEREYDSQMAERLAEEIPAGSSAATAGGGSGFNSPVDKKHAGDGQQASGADAKKAAAAIRTLKRVRTSEGVVGDAPADSRIRKSPRLGDGKD